MFVQRWNIMRQTLKKKSDSRYFTIGVCNLMRLFCWVLLFYQLFNLLYIIYFQTKTRQVASTMAAYQKHLGCILKKRKQMMVITMMVVAKTMRTMTTMTYCWENPSLNLNLPHQKWDSAYPAAVPKVCEYTNFFIHSFKQLLPEHLLEALTRSKTSNEEGASERNFCLHGSWTSVRKDNKHRHKIYGVCWLVLNLCTKELAKGTL